MLHHIDADGAGVILDEQPLLGPPGRGEACVRMRLAPINPADLLMIAGGYTLSPALPAVLGAEGVGVVTAVGEPVDDLAPNDLSPNNLTPGDLVICLVSGNWAQERRLPATQLLRAPETLPLAQAAMLRINPPTAWRLLDQAPLQNGDWVVQNGAGSAVGRLIAASAKHRGFRTVSVLRDPRRGEAGLRAAGGDVVLADGPDLAARVTAATGGAPIRLALDSVAGAASGRMAEVLAVGGRLCIFGHMSGEPCLIPSRLLTGRGLNVSGFSLRPAEQADGPAARTALFHRLALLLADPATHVSVAGIYPLSDIHQAIRAARRAGSGRVLLSLQD